MLYWEINNKLFTGQLSTGCATVILLTMASSAISGDTEAGSENTPFSVLKVAEKPNPWALPKQQERKPELQAQPYQQQPYDYGQQYQTAPEVRREPTVSPRDDVGRSKPMHQWQPQTERFVSPAFLESLKKQQQQYQMMPDNQRYHRPGPRQFTPGQSGSGMPGQGAYGYPSYGGAPVNPLYDAPAVSPWGDGADVLYRGESFPMVPSEALGGFPPMHVPSFGMNNYQKSDSEEPGETDEYKVFNPFTFLPKGGSGWP